MFDLVAIFDEGSADGALFTGSCVYFPADYEEKIQLHVQQVPQADISAP